MRPIDWVGAADGQSAHIRILDQTLLPEIETYLQIDTVDRLLDAIARLAVRGAPALGVAGALGVALAIRSSQVNDVAALAASIRQARPTAVNLARGVDLALAAVPDGPEAVLTAALSLRDAEVAASIAMARRGADLLYQQRVAPDGGYRLLTVCNTGALAAVERGTALAVVEEVFRDGRLARAVTCETRPLLQGARLTAWELDAMGAPFDLIVDSAAAGLMRAGAIDAVLVGADRVAANGDVANKVGTLSLALGARYAGIPFYVVAPESTLDPTTDSGADIVIEDRGSEEVVSVRGVRIAPNGATALNPAFDVTPAELVTAIITDARVIRPAAEECCE